MSAFMLSLFYIYTIYAISFYRKEINYRLLNGYSGKSKVKFKAPFSLRKSVLLSLAAIIINIFFRLAFGNNLTVLINVIPVIFFLFVLRRYEKKLIKMDKE